MIEGEIMKKFICCMLTMSLMGVSLLCGCGGLGGATSSGKEQDPPKTIEEELIETDKNYDRVIYLNDGAAYNLKEQYRYEKISNVGATFETAATTFTVNEDWLITAVNSEDIGSEELTVTFPNEKVEKVMVHVVNRQKYGAKFTTVDAGYLYGKNVVFFGDSITHNWAKYPNGDKTSVETDSLGYNHVPRLNDVCKFKSIVNAAWSGGTVAYLPTSDERFIYKSFPGAVSDHKEDVKKADVIFVWYGTNDLYEQVPIGNPEDTMVADGKTDQNFNASLNYGMTEIYNQNPNADVIVMNIMVRDPSNFGTIKLNEYNEALKLGAERYNAKLLNIFKLFTTRDLKACFKDGLHPNDDGYDKITEYILLTNKTMKK